MLKEHGQTLCKGTGTNLGLTPDTSGKGKGKGKGGKKGGSESSNGCCMLATDANKKLCKGAYNTGKTCIFDPSNNEPYGKETRWVKDSPYNTTMGLISLGKKAKKDDPNLNMKKWKPQRGEARVEFDRLVAAGKEVKGVMLMLAPAEDEDAPQGEDEAGFQFPTSGVEGGNWDTQEMLGAMGYECTVQPWQFSCGQGCLHMMLPKEESCGEETVAPTEGQGQHVPISIDVWGDSEPKHDEEGEAALDEELAKAALAAEKVVEPPRYLLDHGCTAFVLPKEVELESGTRVYPFDPSKRSKQKVEPSNEAGLQVRSIERGSRKRSRRFRARRR